MLESEKKPRLNTHTPPRPLDVDRIPEVDRPTQTTRNINKLVIVAFLVIAIGLGMMIRWGIQSEDVITLNKDPIPTRTIRDHPTAGGIVFLQTDYCKNVSAAGTLRYSYVSDTREIFLPLGKEESRTGCQTPELPVLIPKDIPADTYRIKVRLVYNLNPLKQGIVEEFYSTPVIVDPTTPTNDR